MSCFSLMARSPANRFLRDTNQRSDANRRLSKIFNSSSNFSCDIIGEIEVRFRKAGKQVLNADANGAVTCLEVTGDHLAVFGDNGKILIFPLVELPEMSKGKGVKLQSYREGGLRDASLFTATEAPAWTDAAGRTRQWPDWRDWLGRRAGAGRLAPRGFPASKRFRPK